MPNLVINCSKAVISGGSANGCLLDNAGSRRIAADTNGCLLDNASETQRQIADDGLQSSVDGCFLYFMTGAQLMEHAGDVAFVRVCLRNVTNLHVDTHMLLLIPSGL